MFSGPKGELLCQNGLCKGVIGALPIILYLLLFPRWWTPLIWKILEIRQYYAGIVLGRTHIFSCPEQLYRWPCPLVRPAPLTIRVFTTLQRDPRDLWPLRHLIRVMRRHDQSRSLKSTTTATMVGGPKGFGGTKGCNCIFERGDQKCCIVFLKTKIDQEMNI